MFGELDEGLVVRHKCDNRMCINPEHLESGTIMDNVHDAVERGRNSRGSKNGHAMLNEDQVEKIKTLILDGKTNKELSKMFNVDHRIISNIRHERRWTHVQIN